MVQLQLGDRSYTTNASFPVENMGVGYNLYIHQVTPWGWGEIACAETLSVKDQSYNPLSVICF